MSAVGALFDLAQGATSKKLGDTIARVSLIWTAWSVASRFKSVQDVIAFLREVAAEINVTLGWTVTLVFWVLDQVASLFHSLTDWLFAALPFLNLIPDAFREPLIIALLAIVPTLIAGTRFGRLSRCSKAAEVEVANASLAWAALIDDGSWKLIVQSQPGYEMRQQAMESDPEFRNAMQHRRRLSLDISDITMMAGGAGAAAEELGSVHKRAVGIARDYIRVVGFKVFSLRFYLSTLLAVGLAFEFFYEPGEMSAIAVIVVWLVVVLALITGLIIRAHARHAERRDGTVLALHLAYLDSHIDEPRGGALRMYPFKSDSPIKRAIRHVLTATDHEWTRSRIKRAIDHRTKDGDPWSLIDHDDTLTVVLAAWARVGGWKKFEESVFQLGANVGVVEVSVRERIARYLYRTSYDPKSDTFGEDRIPNH